jgi:hypothetical protein
MAKALENAILEQVRQLDTTRQAQVLRYLQALTAQHSSQAWLNFVEACAAELRAKLRYAVCHCGGASGV